MTPKAMSPEEWSEVLADHRLIHLVASDRIVAHIAALEADNAALRRSHEQAGHDPICSFWQGDGVTCSCALEQEHPGAALLERHEKALVRARNEGLEKAAKATDDESSQWAEAEETDDTGSVRRIRDALRDSSKRIRAMKEPEQ